MRAHYVGIDFLYLLDASFGHLEGFFAAAAGLPGQSQVDRGGEA
jgi:hypothetical protein